MNTRVWALLSWFGALSGQAQEGPYLAAFSLTDEEDAVRLNWTMIAGSTCMGTDILRSKDSLNFEIVGSLEGLCGSIDGPVDYTFTDATVPGFGAWYYRLVLGSNGSSPIRRVEHQLSSAFEIRAFPNPADDDVTVVLRADAQDEVMLDLYDAQGRWLSQRAVVGNVHRLDLAELPAGPYVLVGRWQNRSAPIRIIVH